MAPEQLQGRPTDARSDIFSFGALFYEVLTGRRAFDGATAPEIFTAVLRDQPAPLQAPDHLAQIVRRCLEKDPAARFQTAGRIEGSARR